MESIQLGIRDSIGRSSGKKPRDLLYTDFFEVESVSYPRLSNFSDTLSSSFVCQFSLRRQHPSSADVSLFYTLQ
jgi:hypothetical protein